MVHCHFGARSCMMLTVGDLFSGIGGFSLGLERAGMQTRWFAEVDPYASAVLRKHWPSVPNHGDVRSIRAGSVEPVDVLCGGFPCQDISNAGKRAGIDGERSGLWSEYARIIGELRPRYVIVENVAALLGRGLERVLGDLAALGFDAEWHCIPASAVGAPHRRDRVWIVAYADSTGQRTGGRNGLDRARDSQALADNSSADVPDAGRELSQVRQSRNRDWRWSAAFESFGGSRHWWTVEPDMGRVAYGIPRRVDRLRCLGNAIVPQVAEVIGRAIVSAE